MTLLHSQPPSVRRAIRADRSASVELPLVPSPSREAALDTQEPAPSPRPISITDVYHVTFQDGPLGMSCIFESGLAKVTQVDAGSQAELGGVVVNSMVTAIDGDAVTFGEAWTIFRDRPRPFTVTFRRPAPERGIFL